MFSLLVSCCRYVLQCHGSDPCNLWYKVGNIRCHRKKNPVEKLQKAQTVRHWKTSGNKYSTHMLRGMLRHRLVVKILKKELFLSEGAN